MNICISMRSENGTFAANGTRDKLAEKRDVPSKTGRVATLGRMNRGPELQGASVWGQKTLGVGGLHRFPNPVAGPRDQSPTSALNTSSVLALVGRPRELMAPRLLLNQGPSEPCYTTGKPQDSKS